MTGTDNCIASIFATDLLYCLVLRTKMQQERNPLHSKLATHIKPSQIFNAMKLNDFACSLCSTVTFCSSCNNPHRTFFMSASHISVIIFLMLNGSRFSCKLYSTIKLGSKSWTFYKPGQVLSAWSPQLEKVG